MKVGSIAWEATCARILALNQLKRRVCKIPYGCYIYKEDEETNNHILLHCTKAPNLWLLNFALFGVQ